MSRTAGRTKKITVTPHEKRRGILKNGNPSGDLSKAQRCGAKNRRGKPLPVPGDAEWPVQASRRSQYGGKDAGRY